MSYSIVAFGRGIRCWTCGQVSFNQTDIKQRYCGKCHKYHDDGTTSGAMKRQNELAHSPAPESAWYNPLYQSAVDDTPARVEECRADPTPDPSPSIDYGSGDSGGCSPDSGGSWSDS